MFNEGDRVVAKDTRAFGTVLETYEDMACVELDNGVEMEYKLDQLITEDEFKNHEEEKIKAFKARHQGGPSIKDIPYVPRRGDGQAAAKLVEIVRRVYPDILVTAEETAEITPKDDLSRVYALSVFTGTPMIVWMGAGEMNDEGMVRAILVKTILNNTLEGTGLVADVLISKCRRVLAAHETMEDK